MAYTNRGPLIDYSQLIAVSLLLLLATTGIAMAQNPVPLINQPLVPEAVRPGAAGFTLTINGTGFVSGATVNWNGSPLTTTFVSRSRLKASVPASDVATAGTASVTVANPVPGGGVSNVTFFPISLPINFELGGTTLSAGTGPMSVATGDFNRDGKLDLLVGDPGSGNVNIVLGNGDGTFQPTVSYTVGNVGARQAFELAVGDFNGDGRLDFVVSDVVDNCVSVFLGNGDGTFKPGVTYAVGTEPTAVVVADVNSDGNLDIVTSNQNCPSGCGTATVSVLLGNGDGTFQIHSDYAAGIGANWLMVGDFNRDGKLDLAVVDGQGNSYTSAVLILLGNGDGTFRTPASYPLAVNGASGATADFNGDGKLDIAVADNIGLVSILLGNGDGTFQPRVDYTSGSFPWGSFTIGDFNQDNHLDLAVSNFGSNAVAVYFGNGDGTFQLPVLVTTGSSPHGVTAGDFNRDGRLDLTVANLDDNTVSVLLQDGTISLSPSRLNFGAQVVGSGGTKKVTLTNVGITALAISSIAVSGTNAADFSQSNTCGSSLGAGAHCTINVTFTPSQLGPRTASIAVTDGAPGSPHSVPLSGFGVTAGPNATLSATGLTFSTQLVGTSSPPQSLTLSNFGTLALSITSIATTGDFSQSHSCGSTLAPLASCSISVTFKPTQKGSRAGTLSFTDNAPGNPQTVSLKGTGTVVKLNPTTLSFGVHEVGTSATQSTTLTNIGSIALSFTSIVVSGTDADEFSQTNTCGSSVAAGSSCSISVIFKPSEAGGDSSNVYISDNGGGSPQTVPLSGGGCVIVNGRCKLAAINSPTVKSAIAAKETLAVPAPTKSNKIGTRIMALVDSTRDDPFLNDGRKRELLVRFWYPATLDGGCRPAEYTSPRVWSHFAQLTGLPLPKVTTNSCLNAAVTDNAHPIVVFTHGYTGTFTDYTFLFEDLASRGYVVVSIDHTYEATAVEFPNGQLAESLVGSHVNDSWRTDDKTVSFVLSVRAKDLTFIVNELERLNTTAGNSFSGKLDTSRIALMGHSLGGQATLTGLQQEARFKAGVILDGALNDKFVEGTEKPVLILAAGRDQWSTAECKLWDSLTGPRLAVNLKGAEHLTPSDAVWLAKGVIKTGDMGPEKTIGAVRNYIAAFLETNLEGEPPDPLLSGPTTNYRDASITLREQSLCDGVQADR